MTAQILLHPSLAPLDGGINFRDFGGNGVADGRRIKRGLLFRSGSLERLTENDCTFSPACRCARCWTTAMPTRCRPSRIFCGVAPTITTCRLTR